jgi:hypothetical protein
MNDEQQEAVSLRTLAGGAAIELFDDEMIKVLENILDPNTAPDVTRSLKLIVKIKPSKDRAVGTVEFTTQTTMAPPDARQTQLYMGMTKDGPVAVEHNPQQLKLGLDEIDQSGVIEFMPMKKEEVKS